MAKKLRICLGALFVAAGILLFIVPGSMLFLLLGLMILSYDVPKARDWLRQCQNGMSASAKKLDRLFGRRKY